VDNGLVRLNRTRGEIHWMRAHFDGRLRAEVRGSDRGSWVLVRRGDEPIREARVSVDAEAARETADRIILELFPHDCTDAECGSWVALAAGKK
jgi:hypothetical protein